MRHIKILKHEFYTFLGTLRTHCAYSTKTDSVTAFGKIIYSKDINTRCG